MTDALIIIAILAVGYLIPAAVKGWVPFRRPKK